MKAEIAKREEERKAKESVRAAEEKAVINQKIGPAVRLERRRQAEGSSGSS